MVSCRRAPGLAAVAIACALLTHSAAAQTLPSTTIDAIVQTFQNGATNWGTSIQNYATRLFALLAAIEFIMIGIRMVLKGADLGEIVSEIIRGILFTGFFAWLLANGPTFAQDIINSFRQVGTAVAGNGGQMYPSNIFEAGLKTALTVLDKLSAFHPLSSAGVMVAALVIVVCFAMIAAFMVLALVESYVICSAGVLMLGFGGSSFTKDFAINYFKFAMSIGAKLLVMELLVGLGQQMVTGWANSLGTTDADMFVVVGCAVVFLALVKSVPDLAQGMVNGSSISTGAAIGAAAGAVAGAVGGALAGAAGAGFAVKAAHSASGGTVSSAIADATSAISAGGKEGGARGAAAAALKATGSVASAVGQDAAGMAGALGSAAAQDIGGRITGKGGPRFGGTLGGRMANAIQDRARAGAKPRPPAGGVPDSFGNMIGPA